MRVVKGVIGLVLFFGLLYIGIQFSRDNNQAISLNLPGGWQTVAVELWALVVISAAAGAALATLIFLVQIAAVGLGKRKLSRRVKLLERELNDLRNMPLSQGPDVEAPGAPERPSGPAGPAEPATRAGGTPSV